MKQQFARGLRLMVLKVAVRILVDMGVVQENLGAFDTGERIADLALPGAKGFDLGSAQNDTRLEGLEDMVVAPRFRIRHDVGHGRQNGIREFRRMASRRIRGWWYS